MWVEVCLGGVEVRERVGGVEVCVGGCVEVCGVCGRVGEGAGWRCVRGSIYEREGGVEMEACGGGWKCW